MVPSLPCNLSQLSQVCLELLNQNFGDIVGKVGGYLLRRKKRPLRDVIVSTGLSYEEVRKALAILIQHNLAEFTVSEGKVAEYSILPSNVFCLLRFPKYLFMIKTYFGDESEVLLEELLNQGQDSASNLIFRSVKRLQETVPDEGESSISPLLIYEKFQNLAIKGYFMRAPQLAPDSETKIPKFVVEERLLFTPPTLDLGIISQKLKENSDQLGEYSDSQIVWRVNFDRFSVDMRKEILVNAAARRVDPQAGVLYHLLFEMWNDISPNETPVSNPISLTLIKDAIRKKYNAEHPLSQYCDQYLKVLAEDSSNLITKSGDSGGGQYVLNYKNVFTNLACASLDSIVLEKFGSKATRIFRLTRLKNYQDQDQLQQLSMIPAKEAKMHTYKLLEHSFLQIKELRKGNANAGPVKCFFLFYVDVPTVVRTTLDNAYKALYNVLVRREYELARNKPLLDKQQKIETYVSNARKMNVPEEDIAEVEEMLTLPEKTLLTKLQNMTDNLTLGQLQVDETILVLETYLKYSLMK